MMAQSIGETEQCTLSFTVEQRLLIVGRTIEPICRSDLEAIKPAKKIGG
jgi:hypothetical protein